MEELGGRVLVAAPEMGDPNFERTVIWMMEHNNEGSLGIVLNRPSEVPVGLHLPDLVQTVDDPDVFFVGGPVSTDVVLGLGLGEDGITIVDLDSLITGDLVRPTRLRLFAGYSGWAGGQLAGELASDAWFVLDADPADVFDPNPGELWRTILGRQTGALGRLKHYPDSPLVN